MTLNLATPEEGNSVFKSTIILQVMPLSMPTAYEYG